MIPLHCLCSSSWADSARASTCPTRASTRSHPCSMQVPFVGFQPVRTSEHMAALGVFGLLQLVAFVDLVRSHVPQAVQAVARRLCHCGRHARLCCTGGAHLCRLRRTLDRPLLLALDTPTPRSISPSSPRSRNTSLPHGPRFFFDLEMLIFLFPVGVFLLFKELRDEHVFVIIYAVMASYFAASWCVSCSRSRRWSASAPPSP